MPFCGCGHRKIGCHVDTADARSTTSRVVAITGLCGVAVACNVLGPGIFWNARNGSLLMYFAFVASGALIAEVVLLGTWCSLSLQPIKYRLPVTATFVVIGACSYCIGLQLADPSPPEQGIPVEVALLIAVAGLGTFAVIQIPLWVIRRATQFRIAIPATAVPGESLQKKQFSIRYLMLGTAVVAVVLVLVRNSLPGHSVGISLRELMEILMLMLSFIGLSSLLSVPCLWIALTEKPSLRPWLVLVCAFVAGPFLVLVCSSMIFGPQVLEESLLGVPCYEVGLTGTLLAGLWVLRSLGYRMLVAHSAGDP